LETTKSDNWGFDVFKQSCNMCLVWIILHFLKNPTVLPFYYMQNTFRRIVHMPESLPCPLHIFVFSSFRNHHIIYLREYCVPVLRIQTIWDRIRIRPLKKLRIRIRILLCVKFCNNFSYKKCLLKNDLYDLFMNWMNLNLFTIRFYTKKVN
jgi:hypothetical protein